MEFLSDSDPNNQRSTPISVGDTLPPIIIHEPKVSVKFLDTLTISVQVTDNGSGVRNVTIYYKSKSESEYFSIPMNKVPDMDDIYSYEIPREDVTLDDLEYFIKADDWASVTNTVYFGDDGLIQEMPNSDTDIDVDVREKKDTDDDGADSDDNFLEDIGGPFGLKHIGVCLLVIILLVVLLVCFIFAVRSAFQARALANHSTKYKTETVEGDRVLWEGEDMEELDEAEDLNTIGDEDDELQEGL